MVKELQKRDAKNKFEIDMCHGTIMDKLISFALPLMFSGILQLLFNAADVVVVGRFSGKTSLAAVGSTTALINTIVNLFIGISLGVNVIAARYFAAKEEKEMSETVHTSITVALISGFCVGIIGIFVAKPALLLMGTPETVIEKSVLYMRIYFCGMPFFMLYNYGAAVLRAVGDTKRPMLFLIISGSINVFLNLLLVIVFKLDVAGVAIATAISQFVSSVLVISCLMRTDASYKLSLKKLCIKKKYLIRILQVGIPAGIQTVVINVSNALLQSSVNSLGDTAMAGYTASNNITGFLYVSVNSISQACMSFTSQNYAVRNMKRMDKILRDCLILETIVPLIFGGAAFFFSGSLISIYSPEKDVIKYGVDVLSIIALPYFICGYMDLFPGALRGMGHSSVPMILSVVGTVGTRIVWIFGFFPHHRTIDFLFWSYPISWIITFLLQIGCYILVRRKVKREFVGV